MFHLPQMKQLSLPILLTVPMGTQSLLAENHCPKTYCAQLLRVDFKKEVIRERRLLLKFLNYFHVH
jgi:hypothetical protein